MSTTKITKRTVDAAQASDRVIWIWDSEVRGFGLKVTLGGQKYTSFSTVPAAARCPCGDTRSGNTGRPGLPRPLDKRRLG